MRQRQNSHQGIVHDVQICLHCSKVLLKKKKKEEEGERKKERKCG
jgi:hypothetical protein